LKLKSKSRWSVRLGPLEWAKYTYERTAEDSLELLGSARCGLQCGALGKLDNEFVLVVGDHVTPLSHADSKALAAATSTQPKPAERPFVVPPVVERVAPPVVVTIKRRRIPLPH